MNDEEIEALAIRAAKGNNGGEWAKHYTEAQKDYWRQFVRDLVATARESSARIADEYSDWTYWGQDANFAAAQLASLEIAEAIRKGRHLTTEEISRITRKPQT